MKLVSNIPLHHTNPKQGECPYCYDGHLIYDRLTKLIHCANCNYTVRLVDKENKVVTLR